MDELKQRLVDAVNTAQLPPEAIYYVVKDFYRDVVDSFENFKKQVEEAKARAKEAEASSEKQEEKEQ